MARLDDGGPPAIRVTREEVRRLCEFLYRRTGMLFPDNKRYFIDRRLAERIAATGSESFSSYYAMLRSDAEQEIEQLVNAFTVNETYFFREEHQLRCMTTSLLGELMRRKQPGDPFRIWSIPCSTGEEPYSIAIWLMEHWGDVDKYNIEIVGSDIDTSALKAAAKGVYGERALMRLSRDVVRRYFNPLGDAQYQIDPGLRQSVQFTAANLIDAADIAQYRDFDIVFCRNVLIYFDDSSRRSAAANLYQSLRPGGYICLGHSETMSRVSALFRVRRFPDAIVYQKPEAGEKVGLAHDGN
jgi:chemotaxis protein methyltransferase CheR